MTDERDDAPDIPSALSAEQWADRFVDFANLSIGIEGATLDDQQRILRGDYDAPCRLTFADRGHMTKIWFADANALAAIIALANEVLCRMDDPRAVTRGHVTLLREMAERIGNERTPSPGNIMDPNDDSQYRVIVAEGERMNALSELADAMESLLPPDPAIDRNPFKNDSPMLGFPPLPPT